MSKNFQEQSQHTTMSYVIYPHTPENRMAILGSNERDGGDDNDRNKIPIIGWKR